MGGLSLDEEPEDTVPEFRQEAGGRPVSTSKSYLTVMVLNLGNFERGRKNTVPREYREFVSKGNDGISVLVRAMALMKSHVFLLQEASTLSPEDLTYLKDNCWEFCRNPAGDLMIAFRTNHCGQHIKMVAGSTYDYEDHKHMPLSYQIVDICFGSTLSSETLDAKLAGFPKGKGAITRQNCQPQEFDTPLTRAGLNRIRICNFHLRSHIARKKVALSHESLAIMMADCFSMQVDIIGGDANMAAYRFQGSTQASASIRDSSFQDMVRYFCEAYKAALGNDPFTCPKPRFMAANPLGVLHWYEETYSMPYRNAPQVDWRTAPSLDCIVACVLEWDHSYSPQRWPTKTDAREAEYKIHVSEWVLNTNRSHYMLVDSDNDSHMPLLFTLTPMWLSNQQRKELDRRGATVKEAADRRKERQKANKAKAQPQEAPPAKGAGKGKEKGLKGKFTGKGKGKTKGKK